MKKGMVAVGTVIFLFGLLLFLMGGNRDGMAGQTFVLLQKHPAQKENLLQKKDSAAAADSGSLKVAGDEDTKGSP